RKFRLLRSRQLGGEPGRPPALAVDRFDYRPSDIRSPRSRHRQSPPPSSPGGMRATDPRSHEPMPGGGIPPPASLAAARAPRAAKQPRRREKPEPHVVSIDRIAFRPLPARGRIAG